uniref:Uncharacterized protein n=1 Tax=Oreochromis niloticus TaxID=8128 RepID=A0A669E619_ORENI
AVYVGKESLSAAHYEHMRTPPGFYFETVLSFSLFLQMCTPRNTPATPPNFPDAITMFSKLRASECGSGTGSGPSQVSMACSPPAHSPRWDSAPSGHPRRPATSRPGCPVISHGPPHAPQSLPPHATDSHVAPRLPAQRLPAGPRRICASRTEMRPSGGLSGGSGVCGAGGGKISCFSFL